MGNAYAVKQVPRLKMSWYASPKVVADKWGLYKNGTLVGTHPSRASAERMMADVRRIEEARE